MEIEKRIATPEKRIIITRKIRLFIDIPRENKDKLNQAFRKLYNWQTIAFKASNLIVSHLYFQEQAKEFIYLNENNKLKLANYEKDNDGMLNTSRLNSTYRVISQKFKNDLPTSIITCLNHNIYLNFIKEKSEYYSGKRSLRSYKSSLPVPIRSDSIYDLRFDEKIKNYRFQLFKDKKYSIPFKTYLGRDLSNNKVIIEKCLTGEYQLHNSAYKICDGKVFLFITVLLPVSKELVNPNITVKAMLSFLAPVLVCLNEKQYFIGDKESYLYKRLAFQQGLKRRQQLVKYNKGGKGRIKKIKGIEEFEKEEKNYIDYYTHYLSHELIKFCLKNKAGKLELTDIIQNINEAKENPFVLRNWSYGNLLNKIDYKCKINNIELVIN